MNDFDDIMQCILEALDANPEADAEGVLVRVAGEMGLSAEEIKEMTEAFAVLDEVNVKAESLQEARDNGQTRDGWLRRQLDDISGKCGDDAPTVLEEIEKGVHASLEKTVSDEEV